ncbi:MAG TPA: dTMP kinase [Anaerolineae bacterium]|jgi:dTMP kinase|nr:dTMP kinase [Anaerolineae bacterium]
MTALNFYGNGLPNLVDSVLPGKFIVIEGTDGVGRSTQIALLREWLESRGYAVGSTGLSRSLLAGDAIKKAKDGHTLSESTLALFYATDLADRLEHEIIPALRAGMVVLTDRYLYSIIARAQVRGVDARWARRMFGFALMPDAVFYLKADVAHLIPRVLGDQGFDYWESGMDYLKGSSVFRNFVKYQTQLLAQFDAISEEFNFRVIDANRSVRETFYDLRREIGAVVSDLKKQPIEEPAVPTDDVKAKEAEEGAEVKKDEVKESASS